MLLAARALRLTVRAAALLAVACVVAAATTSLARAEDWPQWRGPNRDGVSTETGLAKEWPKEGPQVLWSVDAVGVGYSSIAVKDGRIYTQGDLDGVEHVICLSADNGRVIWAKQPEPAVRRLAEQVVRLQEYLDANQDGVIDEAEALSREGWRFADFDSRGDGDTKRIAAERAERLFQRLDKDGDGELSYDEAGRILRDRYDRIDTSDDSADAEALARDRTAAEFKQLDADGDGAISREESRGSLVEARFGEIDQRDPTTNEPDQRVTIEELRTFFASRQKGKDGAITRRELESYYAANHPGADGLVTKDELRSLSGGLRDGMGNGPRGTPTVEGNRVYAEGGTGDVTCFDAESGRTIWHVNLSENLEGGRPGWGYSESPLIEGELLIVTPGGRKGTVAALNKNTGEVVWRSEGVSQGAGYASPVAADIAGTRQIVIFGQSSLFGVTADEGKLLWQYDHANNGTANCATPVVADDRVFASSSYSTGGGLAHVERNGDSLKASEVYFERRMANHHGGIVKVGEYMYGFGNGGLICMNFATGEIAWTGHSVGKGSLVVADGMLFLLSEGHEVALAEASPGEYRELGRFSIPQHGKPSWAHPVVAGGRLYIRDQESLTAYDVSE